jgi:putative transcriptional regulator
MSSLAGKFLVARPVLRDPSFRQTVVLLLQHGPEGAFGLVVNRLTKAEGLELMVCNGGPCPMPGLMLLHGHAEWADAEEDNPQREVAPGIFLGDAACFERVKGAGKDEGLRYRIFTGYAGWGADQLEGELAAGAWAVTAANGQLLFDTPVAELWDRLVPPTIPQPSLN